MMLDRARHKITDIWRSDVILVIYDTVTSLLQISAALYCFLFCQQNPEAFPKNHRRKLKSAKMARFMQFNEAELAGFCQKKHTKNTDRSTQTGVNILRSYLEETGSNVNVETYEPEELNKLLIKFYAGVRTKKGELYKLNSMRTLRFSLQRHFLELWGVDIIESDAFVLSNTCFENILKEIKKSGKGSTSHHPEIEPEDLKKLYQSFNIETPSGLQEKVWLDVMLYLIRRGRENLRQMTKETFAISTDATGKKFVSQNLSELDKNHGIHDDGFDSPGEGRIYETGDEMCPVKSFEAYLSHLHPMENSLWQRPLEKTQTNSIIWYCRVPLGERMLGDMMAKMSTKYNLSERYTNHSVRVTSLQLLDDSNVEGRHICKISGHKSTDSLKSYARKLSTSRKRNISDIISKHVSSPSNNQPCPTKRNFQLVPDSFVDFVLDDASPPSTSATSENQYLESIPPNNLFANNLVVSSDLNPEDNFFHNIPSHLLVSSSNNNNNSSPIFPFHFPLLNNCDNCTINFNIYQK